MEEDVSLFPEEGLLASDPLVEDGNEGLSLESGLLDSGGTSERDTLNYSESEAESSLEAAGNAAAGSCSEKEQDAAASKGKEKRDIQAKSRELQLRKDLNSLDALHKKKDLSIQKIRRELHACRQRLDFIIKQQATVAADLAVERETNNIAAVGRLQAVSRRLCTELEREEEQKSQLMAMLRESESAMWQLDIRKVQFEDFQQSARKKTLAASRCLQVRAAKHLRQEEAASARRARSQRLRARKSMYLQKEQGVRQQKLLVDAQRNHRVAVKFLKASLGRIREREREEELASQEHLRRRMDAVLALKNSIAANRELLRKVQAWGQAQTSAAQQKAQAEEKEILALGGDAFKHLTHQRKRQELEAQTKAFEEEQKLRKLEIVSQILKEENEEEKRKKQQPEPAQATPRLTLRDKTWKYISDFSKGTTWAAGAFSTLIHEHDLSVLPRTPHLPKATSTEFVQGDLWAHNTEEETLAEPEIPGLWDEDHKAYQAPKEDTDRKPVGGTAMEKDILARTLQRLRSGLVHKQVVSGREFKGCPFNSKPKVIHFKDFDVGKVYKKKITLINATYTINYCRLESVEEHLRDFIHVHFDPPGPMSAGMSCEVLVTFKPLVNKDMEGSISFLAQTGRFSVPLKCSTKKCSLKLDKQLIDFGSYVVGETTTRVITLTNVGGLATKFTVLPESEVCELDSLPAPRTQTNLFGYEEKIIHDKITSFSENYLDTQELFTDHLLVPRGLAKTDSRDPDEKSSSESDEMVTATFVMSPQCEDRSEITLGEVREGKIDPFCSVKVPVIFTPATPGVAKAKFKVLFTNQQCPTLLFSAIGTAVDVPVWLPKPEVDLKICMYDRLYQDSILIHTRSKAALRLKLEVCKELRAHCELLPETGYIQALSSFSVQLKFLPRHSLPEDAGKYFDKESRVLEAPMTIRVADQVRPVEFTVHAILTSSDLQLSPSVVDFGHCTIYEAVRAQISLRNCSFLPQGFGFVGLPEFVDIQPSDGFGTILPLETLQLDAIFQPTEAKEYHFDLICKSEIGRCFKLTCRAVAVSPPLALSHCQIKFAATSLDNSSVAALHVLNTHRASIGSKDPTSFQFLVPEDAPITISPCVGSVLPGKRCLTQVTFSPKLPTELQHQETLQIKDEDKLHRRSTASQKRELRKPSVAPRHSHEPDHRTLQEPASRELVTSSDQHHATQATLARSFPGKFDKFVIPCVVASGDLRDREGTESLNFSPHNTLYLELWCPTVAPSILVMSNNGRTVAEFDEVAIGHSSLRKISIQNVSPDDLQLDFSLLNPDGPFVLLNPISKLAAGESHVLVLTFSPHESVLFHEALDIISKRGTLTLTLKGTGVEPMIACSIHGDVLHMGYVIARESVSMGFKLQNCSLLPVEFSMQLDSLARRRPDAQAPLPRFLSGGAVGLHRTEVVGTQNFGGQSVFSVVPVEGVMEPGQTQDFTVTFSPDHESLYFSDRLQVVLFKKNVSRQILLRGAAREHSMFVEGGDPLDVPVESLSTVPLLERGEGSAPHLEAEELKGVLVTLDYIQLHDDTPAPPATRELQVGCIRSSQPASKKVVDFSLDSVSSLQHKGFTVEPTKGSVERGQTKTISISWVPPPNFDSDHPLVVSALLQLRGDAKETYKILFVAQVQTGTATPSPPVLSAATRS